MAGLLVVGLVEDNRGDARLIQEMLSEAQGAPTRIAWFPRLADALAELERGFFDVFLLDLGLPDSQGLATFDRVHQRAPRMPIIIISGVSDEELAAEAVARGAQDYLVKGQMDGFLLKRAIRYAVERKRAESEIQELNDALERRVAERTAQLEKAYEELAAFSYSVSHDLRAPLRSIDGFSYAILEDCASTLDPRSADYLRRVRTAAQRMGELIDDLLELSRVGRADLRRGPIDLSEMARGVIAELRRQEPDRHVAVEIEDGLTADADGRLIRVALENLIGNAWKFTARAAPPRIQLLSERAPEGVVFLVRDNGAGFDMTYVDKLFRPFQRLHTGAEFTGTGIGLATVHRIIDRHGGRVWADAAPNLGATFYFTLNAAPPAE